MKEKNFHERGRILLSKEGIPLHLEEYTQYKERHCKIERMPPNLELIWKARKCEMMILMYIQDLKPSLISMYSFPE